MRRTVHSNMKLHTLAVIVGFATLMNLAARPYAGAPTVVHASVQQPSTLPPVLGDAGTNAVPQVASSPVQIASLATPAYVSLTGSSVSLQTAISAQTLLSGLQVSLEVYSPSWSSVYAYRTTLSLAALGSRQLSASWPIPSSAAAGTYHALVNVFNSNWTTHFAELCCTSIQVVSSANTIALGAWMPGANAHASVVDQYARLTGRSPAIVNFYQSWLPPNPRNLDVSLLRAYQRKGVTPMISWEPDVPDRTILSGSYDSFIRRYAHDAAAYGKPILLRFAWEENGNWTAWSPGVNGNTADSFVAAWRHIHDIFEQEHATNVQWVWAPNVAYVGSVPFSAIYPGDAYVDWMALDGYNWGQSIAYHYWTSASQLFRPID